MNITFKVGDETATFYRNWFTGRAVMTVAERTFKLQSPWNAATHLSFRLTRVWEVDLPQHKIVVEKVRPLLFSGFRANDYKIIVDGELVAQERGF
jgi:hypothetical protein